MMTSKGKTPTTSITTISKPSTQNIMEEITNAKEKFRTIEQISENSDVI